jgi:hypothetical protein
MTYKNPPRIRRLKNLHQNRLKENYSYISLHCERNCNYEHKCGCVLARKLLAVLFASGFFGVLFPALHVGPFCGRPLLGLEQAMAHACSVCKG